MEAAFDVSSSTSIFMFEMEVLVVPEKLEPLDGDRSVLILGMIGSFSTSEKRRFRGLGLRSTA
jgi:hypothetical protein